MQPKSDFGDCKINKPVGCQVKGRKEKTEITNARMREMILLGILQTLKE